MSKMLDYLKGAGGEASLGSRLGFWRQAVSGTVDNLVSLVALITGGGLLPATGTTTGARPLNGYQTALLQTGDEVFVQGVNEVYYFDAASALTADGLNVVDAVGPGQFLRLSSVIVQADWYVDSVAGDDENPGTAAAPLQTLSELAKRWSGKVLWSSVTAATIHLLGTFPTETLSLLTTIVRGQQLNITSTLTTEASGTLTTYTARNAAGNTSATILADISFATHVKRRIRLTSGANIGARAWVLADLGGNTCRVSGFAATDGTAITPANGVTFVVESFPTVVGGCAITPNGGGSVFVRDVAFQAQSSFLSQSFYIMPTGTVGMTTGANFQNYGGFDGCFFTGANSIPLVFGQQLNCCGMNAGVSFTNGKHAIQSCAFYVSASSFNSVISFQAGYSCFEGAGMSLSGQTMLSQLVDIQVFAGTGSRWALVTDQSAWIYGAAVRIYGGSNTFTVAFEVRSGCSLQYITNKPGITGNNPGVNDIKLGGVDTGWAAVPTITAANGAMAVVRV